MDRQKQFLIFGASLVAAGLLLVAHTAAFLVYGWARGCWPWEPFYNVGTRLDQLLALGPEHVSAYALTVERGTRYFTEDKAGRLVRPEDDLTTAMFRAGLAALAAAGFAQYEISSHARPGRRAVHNQLYWTQGAYLGVGASAASFRPLVGPAGGAGDKASGALGGDLGQERGQVGDVPLHLLLQRQSLLQPGA